MLSSSLRLCDPSSLDRGADNPTAYIPNYHETRKGGQGPTQGCSASKEEDPSSLFPYGSSTEVS
jgi:hypothetical protein